MTATITRLGPTITYPMIEAFLDRALEVTQRRYQDGMTEVWNDGTNTYDIAKIYRLIIEFGSDETTTGDQFGQHFVTLMLQDSAMQAIERECCDPIKIKKLKGTRLLQPILLSGSAIIDGNHRAVKRWKLGQTFAPAFMVPDSMMDAARINYMTMMHRDGTISEITSSASPWEIAHSMGVL